LDEEVTQKNFKKPKTSKRNSKNEGKTKYSCGYRWLTGCTRKGPKACGVNDDQGCLKRNNINIGVPFYMDISNFHVCSASLKQGCHFGKLSAILTNGDYVYSKAPKYDKERMANLKERDYVRDLTLDDLEPSFLTPENSSSSPLKVCLEVRSTCHRGVFLNLKNIKDRHPNCKNAKCARALEGLRKESKKEHKKEHVKKPLTKSTKL